MSVVVPRRAGNQVARNRIKRLFREAFRHERVDWERGWDLVVYVRSDPGKLTLGEAVGLLKDAVGALDRIPPSYKEDSQAC
jgi:ribonuclease P protein component